MKVIFLHPDLGIGGAERLVVDAAVALHEQGHRVSFMTGYHDKTHCFEETKDGTFYVKVLGSWIPRKVFGRFHALFAYLKMIYIALYLSLMTWRKPDVIICDQVSACIFILKIFSSAKIVFYCHFPDKLLTKRENFLKKVYRSVIDWIEERTTGLADVILVNSHFTAETFRRNFPTLKNRELHILYPSLNVAKFKLNESRLCTPQIKVSKNQISKLFLSINRYERKKNLPLAIKAFAMLGEKISKEEFEKCSLVLAGGYDKRLSENVEHFKELKDLAESLGLKNKVKFLRSISNGEKISLLRAATSVLYTPSHEHFGIVPIEAMYTENPVIAVNNGGPCETVVDKKTGFLCEAHESSFSDAMKKCLDDILVDEMGKQGLQRVLEKFSFESFSQSLNEVIHSICYLDDHKSN